MAISARQASLLAQRSSYNPYGSTGRIRLLNPSNNAINSIAKQTANNELDIMVKKYNAGQVSNQDFKDFLTRMQTNPGLSEVDRQEISLQVKDFDSKIQGDRLIANYNAAPDNTLQQLQAAQAVANYYKTRAASMQPDTPNYTDAVNAASKYDGAVAQIQKNVNLKAQRALRYSQEQEINKIAGNTSEKAAAKAEKWKALYDLAVSQEDQESAAKYAASYNQELTNAQALGEREVASANKKQLSDFINTTINDYHDGKLTGEQALQQLQSAEQFAADTNDTSTQLRLNNLAMTIYREIDKGITYSSEGGLSVKNKGGGSGSGGELYLNPDGSVSYGGGSTSSKSSGGTSIGTKVSTGGLASKGTAKSTGGKTSPASIVGAGVQKPTTFPEIDINYKNELNAMMRSLEAGEITAEQYEASRTILEKDHAIDLQNIIGGLNQILEINPKAKSGGKDARTLLEGYTTELQNVTTTYNGLRTGSLVLSMNTNKTFTDPTGQTISKPSLELVPKSSLGANDVNVRGIYYTPREDVLTFNDRNNAAQYAKDNGGLTVQQDQNGKFFVVDADGNAAKTSYLDITDTGGNVVTYQNNPVFGNNWLPVGDDPQTAALRQQIISEIKSAKDGQSYEPKILNYSELQKYAPNTPVGTVTGQVKPTALQTAGNFIKPVTDTIGNVASSVVAPVTAPQQFASQNKELILPPNIPAPKVEFQSTQPSSSPGSNFNAPQPSLKLASTPSPSAVALKQAVNPTNKTPVKINTSKTGEFANLPKVAPPPPTKDQYSVGNSLKKLVNTLSFGLIKF